MEKIEPVIKNYPWGNDYFIASLLNGEGSTSSLPQAELWIGTHSQGCSKVDGVALDDFLKENPSFSGSSSEFPFLFKVLAIDNPLSIQCHPNAEQAREGFLNERKDSDRSQWNYQDANPKAEMLYALTPVTAMCGFRPFEEITSSLSSLMPINWNKHFSECSDISSFFHTLYTLEKYFLKDCIKEFTASIRWLDDYTVGVFIQREQLVLELAEKYPQDPGVFAPFFLNMLYLEPGQAVYLKPGILHAYVFGNGIELMNNSDNVLRAGLTAKHMDVAELEKIMSPQPYQPQVMEGFLDAGGWHYNCEGGFSLSVMGKGPYSNSVPGFRALLCTEGSAVINGGQTIKKGECYLVGFDTQELEIESAGVVFMASMPITPPKKKFAKFNKGWSLS